MDIAFVLTVVIVFQYFLSFKHLILEYIIDESTKVEVAKLSR